MRLEEYDDWMIIDEPVTVAAKLTEEDVYEAIASTSKVTQVEACEVSGDVCEEILLLRTSKKSTASCRDPVAECPPESQRSVSYTHLDVYKRQVLMLK